MTRLPYLSLRGNVLYPGMEMTITIGRPETVRAVRRAVDRHDGSLFVVTQRQVEHNSPASARDMFRCGTLCKIEKAVFMTDDTVRIHVEAKQRAEILDLLEEDGAQLAVLDVCTAPSEAVDDWRAAAALPAPDFETGLGPLLMALYRREKTGVDALDLMLFNDAVAARQAVLETDDAAQRATLVEALAKSS